MIFNVPPGVIDSPGLCDTDLAKTTLNKNNNNNKKNKKNKKKKEEEEEEEEEK